MKYVLAFLTSVALLSSAAIAQQSAEPSREDLNQRIQKLETEVNELKQIVVQLQAREETVAPVLRPAVLTATASEPAPRPAPAAEISTTAISAALPAVQAEAPLGAEDRSTLNFLRGTTINLGLDTYYEYNFDNPIGRVNLLRAYDVLSNEFSLNQASLVLEHAPDVAAGHRWGGRLDLQFGQATDTLQGNPVNEPRPEIYRNIFQAYGSYVAPVGKGLSVNFGKWSSSLGIEGNYTKDQINYSRSFWFNFLPFYHMGALVSYPVSDRFSLNYWIVNGTNQVEATNGFKDELFGVTAKPLKTLTWTFNYYLGQDHPDRTPVSSCGPVPVQPGLCFVAITPAPDGKTHIFDSYATWNTTPKLTLALEGDYFIQRLWAQAAPGESSAPSHVDGGAAYIQYQLSPKLVIATRAEYMADPQGLFSGISQDLKESTVTFDYKLNNGLLMRYEWRHDYSNDPTFLSDVQGVFKKSQTTAGVGLIWWWGRKEGAW